jgi:tRNA pseudouridine(38-40) synthase
MTEVLLRAAWHGAGFAGAAAVAGQRTVEGELRAALARLGAPDAVVDTWSRTDAGVHAADAVLGLARLGRVASPTVWLRAFAAQLPDDLRVWAAAAMVPGVAPGPKTYVYTLDVSQPGDPMLGDRAWRPACAVSAEALVAAWARLAGPFDFSRVRLAREQRETSPVIDLETAAVTRDGVVRLTVRGAGFPYRGVRALVGVALHEALAASRGEASPMEDGRWARAPAPARGLLLACSEVVGDARWEVLQPSDGPRAHARGSAGWPQ